MAWNLQLVPEGLLLSKFIKNNLIINPNNILNIEKNQLLTDGFQPFNANNFVNIVFQLSLINDNPKNKNSAPYITAIEYIILSNDPNFQQIFILAPTGFTSNYNLSTNYSIDLSSFNIPASSLPLTQSATFTTVAGTGVINIKNWALSGSSGIKKVFFQVAVVLSDGTTATYPSNIDLYDEIVVLSSYIDSPSSPIKVGQVNLNYATSPVYFESNVAGTGGVVNTSDSGIAMYAWDGLILNNSSNFSRNSYNNSQVQLFKTLSPTSLNLEKFPIVLNSGSSNGIGSTALYSSYITSQSYNISSSNNIYFFETLINNVSESYTWTSSANLFWEFNLVSSANKSSNTKFIRHQLIADQTQSILTIIISVDDITWSTDASYIPSALHQTLTINDPNIVAQILQSGIMTLFVECIDFTNNVFQSKLIFKPYTFRSQIVLADFIFTSSLLNVSSNIFGEVRTFEMGAISTIALESNQYGICQGTVSAIVTPNDKIGTNQTLPVQGNFVNLYNSESLNTWFSINNSPSSGTIISKNNTVTLFNLETNSSTNNLSAVEIQGSLPTFSEDCSHVLNFAFTTSETLSSYIKCGYSFDNNLNYSNFIFNDLLKTASGLYLPQNNGQYDLTASLSWVGTGVFGINVYDAGSAQTCSISTTVTNNLFYYSQNNSSGNSVPPAIIKTQAPLSTSNTYNAWISTNGNSVSNLILQSIVLKNQGNSVVSINTGLGSNNILPGQPYVLSSISTNSLAPTNLIISTNNTVATSSVNLIYDFTQLGIIATVVVNIQITNPPDCPTLPSVQYSLEGSTDFINWTYFSNATGSASFSPGTGNLILTFNINDSNNWRYARLRIYKNAGATFDPTQVWKYSSLYGTQIPVNTFSTTGKLIFGFTDTSAKNTSLSQLYNQPTYLRQFISNSSKVIGIIIDFTDYSITALGPVYISLLTESGEYKTKTIYNDFTPSSYSATLSVARQTADDSFKLVPSMTISGGNISPINLTFDEIITEPSDTLMVPFGYYPFVSLVGSGQIDISSEVYKGTFSQSLPYSNNKTYFSLLSAENPDYTANYAKNLLTQNSYNASFSSLPEINSYFSSNVINNFDYNNVTYTVQVVCTSNLSLYGLTYVDGIYVTACDLILVAGQIDPSQNGVYQVQNQQWVKQNITPPSGLSENTILVTTGNVFGDSLWMQDNVTSEWVSNLIVCPVVLNDNSFLFTGISSFYKYPNYIKIGVSALGISTVNNQNQVKLKLSNSPNVILTQSDSITQWNSVLQNGQLNVLSSQGVSNATSYANFSISSSQIASISTSIFPAIYNLIISYSGVYQPLSTTNSYFSLPAYGSDYRIFQNSNLIYQLFSSYENISVGQVNNSIINTGVYGINIAGARTLQSGFSTDIILDNIAPSVGILSVISNQTKSITLGLSTVSDSGSGLSIGRIIQKTPTNEVIYGSWIGFNSSSYNGISTLTAYPSFVTNSLGLATGEPLSGYYRYYLEVADAAGNVAQTNQVESLYFESAVLDTQGPQGTVSFVDSKFVTPISITSSTILSAQLFAKDIYSGVKSFRYKILPDNNFSNWLDFSNNVSIVLPSTTPDGVLSVQFQFKDFANNVLYSNTTVTNDNYYVYTWNIVSKFLSNVVFTVVETTTYNNDPVILVGAIYNNSAALFVWDSNKLLQLQFPGFSPAIAITAMLAIGNQVLIGTDAGQIFVYQNGAISGPFGIFKIGSQLLPVSKFTVHSYNTDTSPYVYATTLNIPRIYRTPISNLHNLSWQLIQTPPISVTDINVLNTGLWSGNSISYSISSSYVPPILSPSINYGISTIIIGNKGTKYTSIPSVVLNGPILGASLSPVMQGYIDHFNLFNGGIGYTAGAILSISAPSAGGIQAVGYANTDSTGTIYAVGVTSAGYGYTQIPTVSIIGVSGGSKAVVTPTITLDSIFAVNVVSAGIATTTAITISVLGNGQNAQLTPTFVYNIPSVSIVNPGFGFTSIPGILINGISTLATATILNGSINSVSVNGVGFTFPISQTPVVSTVGGFSTNWIGTLVTSAVSFSTGSSLGYNGTILSSISLGSSGFGIATLPSIIFSSSIYNPDIQFVLSDDIILSSAAGSIYDIKSFDNNLFFTSSSGDIIELTQASNVFHTIRKKLNISSNIYEKLTPQALALATDGISTSLLFSIKEEPLIGVLEKKVSQPVFAPYNDNILSFKPYNFDILSDWQLVKNLNANGIGTVKYGDSKNSTLLIQNTNGQVYYQSTKTNTWFNRCTTSSSFLVTFIFSANYGTQSAQISTFNTNLQISFTVVQNQLQISFGNLSYSFVFINAQDLYQISFIKNNQSLFVYNGSTLVYSSQNFFTAVTTFPIIKFGYIFEPQIITINNQAQYLFKTPSIITPSSFIWNQIKFSFNLGDFNANINSYQLSLPYVMPNSTPVRVLKNLNGVVYAVTKCINDQRSTTVYSDESSKVFQFSGNSWQDVTGNFEVYSQGVNTSFVITSPNDIGILSNSYFITGLTKPVPTKQKLTSTVLLGVSTSIVYEESNIILNIIYPFNAGAAGNNIYLTNNNGLVSLPSSVYFAPNDIAHSISVGLGSTAIIAASTITATDGFSTSSTTISIIPIGISSIGINTNSFVGYSNANIISTVTLQSIPKTDRTFNMTSSNSVVLSVPNSGVSTVRAGSLTTNITLGVGIATTATSNINISASYRSTVATSSITISPLILSIGLSTNSFVGNQLYGSVILTASVQAALKSNLTLNINSGLGTVLSGNTSLILAGTATTSIPLTIGNAVTSIIPISITGIVTGGISTASTTVYPYTISTAVISNPAPIFGLQTSFVTYSLNTTPTNNVLVTNLITNYGMILPLYPLNLVYPSISTVVGGTISTTYGISTSIQTISGLAFTVQAAPLGYNTTPVPGINFASDIWKITNLIISPTSIVGGGANANGIAQSFIINAQLNYSSVGLATTVILSSNSILGFNTTRMNFFGSATSIGFASGFATSLITGIAITGTGPNGVSSSVYGLTLNPFLVTGVSTSYRWDNTPISNNYTVGGIGATVIVTATMNAYAYGVAQSIVFSSIDTHAYSYGVQYAYPQLGYGTILPGNISTTINLGFTSVYSSISTNITASIKSSPLGVGTTTVIVQPFPGFSAVFNPFFGIQSSQFSVTPSGPLPINVGYAVTFSNGQSATGSAQYSTYQNIAYNAISQDTVLTAQINMFGILQTYYVTGYAKSGGPFGMGYNNSGVLTANYPLGGSAQKIYLGISSIVKIKSGYEHIIALDANGAAWTIGDNTYGQLGYYTPLNSSNVFQKVSVPNINIVKDIFAQNNSTYILTADNSLYSFGSNSVNQLGTSATIVSTFIPQLISTSVNLCSIHNDRGTIVSYNNSTGIQSIYEFGQGYATSGIIGKGVTQFTYAGTTKNISSLIISSVNTGYKHTVASGNWTDTGLGINSSGIFAWGDNTYSQLGTNSPIGFVTTPNIIYKYTQNPLLPLATSVPIELCNLIIADGDASSGYTIAVGVGNSIYFAGSSNSYNSAGVGQITNQVISTYPPIGFATTASIDKISKDSQHYLWTLGIGSVIVSGGAGNKTLATYFNSQGQISYYNSNSYADFGLGQTAQSTQQIVPGEFFIQIYGRAFEGYGRYNTKIIQQPIQYNGSVALNFLGGFGVDLLGNVFFFNNISLSRQWFNFGYPTALSNTIIAICINQDQSTINNLTSQIVNIFAIGQGLLGVGGNVQYTYIYYSQFNNTPTAVYRFTLTVPQWLNTNVTTADGTYIRNYIGVNYSPPTGGSFAWLTSTYNLVVGYDTGQISLFGNAATYTGGTSSDPTFISSWIIPSAASVLCTKSIMESSGANKIYLFVTDSSGNIYAYNGDGSTIIPGTAQYSLGSSSSIPLISSKNYSALYGNITLIESFLPGTIIAATSSNYILVLNNATLAVIASYSMSQTITSITYSNKPQVTYNNGVIVVVASVIYVSTNSGNNIALYLLSNFEIGLNFANISGNYQLLTSDGTLSGVGMTNIFNSATSDTFSVVLDSSRPNG